MIVDTEIILFSTLDAELRRRFRPLERLQVRRERRRMARFCAWLCCHHHGTEQWAKQRFNITFDTAAWDRVRAMMRKMERVPWSFPTGAFR